MKFKKLFALLLCVACFVPVLAGCAEEDSNEYWLNKYAEMGKGQPQVIVPVDIDLYIIKGDNMSEDPTVASTVQDKINQYLYATYYTNVNIKYYTADEYYEVISKLGDDASGIVLIDSEETADLLDGRLADLHPYILGDQYKVQGYGQLNKQICSSLMNAAIVSERGVDKLYMVPNNHIIGSYEIITINKTLAFELGVPYSDSQFAELTTWEDTLALRTASHEQLGTDINANAEVDYKDYNPNSKDIVTRIVNAPYAALKAIEREGIVVNVSKYPVADKAEVCSSAFAVLNSAPKDKNGAAIDLELYKERAMRVIYEINANTNVRNLLQYGIENVNYSIDTITGLVVPNEDKVYDMNIIYTGDVFKALYSKDWTVQDAYYGVLQNKDSEK